jgi:hypothetical protein
MVRHFTTFHGIDTDDPSVHSQYLKTVPPLQGEDRFRCLHRSRKGDGRCGHVIAALHGLRGHLQGIHGVAAKDAMRYVRVVPADENEEIGTNDDDDAVDDDADSSDVAGSTDAATVAYRCTSVVTKGIRCNRLFAHLHALRMHATLTHSRDGSAAEQYAIVEKPRKPDLFCCLHPPRKTSAAVAPLPLRPGVCGRLSATLPELVNHLRDDHYVGKDHRAHYTTAVPWDAKESPGAESNMAGASATSSAPAGGQQPLHRASTLAGANATMRGGGDVSERKDDDAITDSRGAMEESAGENAPDAMSNDSDPPAAAPPFRGYWRCMFEVHGGYCRCGFLLKKQLSAHFRRAHGRDLLAFNTAGEAQGDFVRTPYPLAPDRYACSKEGCEFVHKHAAGVEKHLVEVHGAKDVRSRALFIRVIEADAATAAAMPAPSRKRKLSNGKAASDSAPSPPAAATSSAGVANSRCARSSKRQRIGPQPPAPMPELSFACDDDFLSRHSLHLALPDSLPPPPQLLPLL